MYVVRIGLESKLAPIIRKTLFHDPSFQTNFIFVTGYNKFHTADYS